MQLQGKNILLISPEPWDHIFVSKHHYAVQLSRHGNRVYFLNPPSNTLQLETTEIDGLCIINYKGFVTGLRFFPAPMRRFLMRRVLRKLWRLTGTRFDVIWSFDNSVFFDFSIFEKGQLTISHIVDHTQDFNTDLAATTASICFCNTDLLRARLKQYNKNVFLINHGYNQPGEARAVKLPGVNRVKAIYAGNLNIPYLDWDCLCCAIEENREVDFVFLGPGLSPSQEENRPMALEKARILSLPNAYAVGKVSADLVHAYLNAADLALICYHEMYQGDQVSNPHKVMEYMGSGKVIVATRTLQYINMEPLVVMSHKNSEWPHLVRKVAGDLAYYNSDHLKRERRSFALENTYERQIRRIENAIPLRD